MPFLSSERRRDRCTSTKNGVLRIRDPHPSPAAITTSVVIICFGIYEILTPESVRVKDPFRSPGEPRYRPIDNPTALRLAGVVGVISVLPVIVRLARRRIEIDLRGITVVGLHRRLVPWSVLQCTYRRTDAVEPAAGAWIRSLVVRRRHSLVIEHDGRGEVLFTTTRGPDTLDLLADVVWSAREATGTGWPRATAGTDPPRHDERWVALPVAITFGVHVLAALLQ